MSQHATSENAIFVFHHAMHTDTILRIKGVMDQMKDKGWLPLSQTMIANLGKRVDVSMENINAFVHWYQTGEIPSTEPPMQVHTPPITLSPSPAAAPQDINSPGVEETGTVALRPPDPPPKAMPDPWEQLHIQYTERLAEHTSTTEKLNEIPTNPLEHLHSDSIQKFLTRFVKEPKVA